MKFITSIKTYFSKHSQQTVRFYKILFAISAIAFMLRLVASYQLYEADPSVQKPSASTDMATYMELAKDLKNNRFDKEFYYQPFYYTIFLPITYSLFGENAKGVILMQAFIGALTVLLTGLLGTLLFGKRAGYIAAILLCFSRFHIFYTAYHLMAILQAFWLVLISYLTIISYRKKKIFWWTITALTLAMAILTRGNLILFVPLIMTLIIISLRKNKQILFFSLGFFLFCVLIPQMPFSFHNYKKLGRWTGPSSAADAVLALGNTSESPPGGREENAGAGPMEYPRTYQIWMNKAAATPRIPVSTSMKEWFFKEPLAYLELKFRMFLLFWQKDEIPNNISIKNIKNKSLIINGFYLLDYRIIGSFALGGIFFSLICFKFKKPTICYFLTSIAIYSLSIVLFYVLARFRLPLLPLLAIAAGYFLHSFFMLFYLNKNSQFLCIKKKRVLLIVCLFFGIFFTETGFSLYRYNYEKSIVASVKPNGVSIKGPNYMAYRDNGPFSFGSWFPISLNKKITLTKAFAVSANSEGRVVLNISTISTKHSNIQLSVKIGNRSQSKTFLTSKKGLNNLEIVFEKLKLLKGQVHFLIEISGGDKDFLIVDLQRYYKRTKIQNSQNSQNSQKKIEGELVSELLVFE